MVTLTKKQEYRKQYYRDHKDYENNQNQLWKEEHPRELLSGHFKRKFGIDIGERDTRR